MGRIKKNPIFWILLAIKLHSCHSTSGDKISDGENESSIILDLVSNHSKIAKNPTAPVISNNSSVSIVNEPASYFRPSDFTVNDSTTGQSDFTVNDSTTGQPDFTMNDSTTGQSDFIVNDSTTGQSEFFVDDSDTVDQLNFTVNGFTSDFQVEI